MYYENASGKTNVGRISRALWNQSYKLIGTPDASKVTPIVFDASKAKDANYMSENVGRLMTIEGVTLKNANGKTVWAAEADAQGNQTEVNQGITGLSNVYVRTSTYADFANSVIPSGKVDITGIFTRYGSDWQIYLRTSDDVKANQ